MKRTVFVAIMAAALLAASMPALSQVPGALAEKDLKRVKTFFSTVNSVEGEVVKARNFIANPAYVMYEILLLASLIAAFTAVRVARGKAGGRPGYILRHHRGRHVEKKEYRRRRAVTPDGRVRRLHRVSIRNTDI